MSLIHLMEQKTKWSDVKPEKSCAFVEFMLKRCKKQQGLQQGFCSSYEKALRECKEGRKVFLGCCHASYSQTNRTGDEQ